MIIYVTDRRLNILIQASTNLDGYRITEDLTTEEIDSGVNSFDFTIPYTKDTRTELEESVKVGNFVLKQGRDENYDSLYQIIETEFDTKSQEMKIAAEDAGLDLINKVCSASTQKSKTITQMIRAFAPGDWGLNLISAPTGTKTYTWDGDSTCTERLLSVARLFGCDIFYSFEIERFSVTRKLINITKKRGQQEAIAQLRLNRDIDRIVTKSSIAELTTAYRVTGGTPNNSNKPINLKNYNYSYTDPKTGDIYKVDKPTGQMRNITAMKRWSSVIDRDGYILKNFSFDTKNQATLAGQARAELQKTSQAAINYEVDFANLPDDIRIGDRVNIIDEDGELYLEARILKLETSASTGEDKATVGEFLLKGSGISETVSELAAQFATYAVQLLYTVEISSSAGEFFIDSLVDTMLTAHVYRNGIELTDDEVAEVGTIKWYQGENLLAEGKTYTITAEQEIEVISITARLEGESDD